MIVQMRAGVGKLQIEHIAAVLYRAKYDVLIRKEPKGHILIAALGAGHIELDSVSSLTGVERVYANNRLFTSTDGKGFEEFAHFFRNWGIPA